MSTDFDVICERCRRYLHIGQRFANGRFVSGYGSTDEEGQRKVTEFLALHIDHQPRIVNSQFLPDGYEDQEGAL